ncbi:MAG: hypothetical protein KC493_13600 [Bacteriovoracaceae bacterium]|nr:hypothetical protein [Bacteriovoracaceae bacterium]
MKRADIDQLLERLNEKLTQEGEKRELVVCGGAALILSNYNKVETVDVDMVSPNKDELLQKLSKEVAKDLDGVRPDWLNSHAATFFENHNPLPENWEDRLVEIFEDSHLKVSALAPEDILFSKICSHIDREMDEEDIKELADTQDLFEKVVEQVVGLPKYKDQVSDLIIDELRTRLGFKDEN